MERLLTKPKALISQPDSHPPPAPGSIESISSITHTSSSDATSSNSTPPVLGPPSPQDDPALKVGELPAAALKQPPTQPSSPSARPVNPKLAPPPPGPKPPPSAPKGIESTGNVAPTSKPPPLAPKGTKSTGNVATTPQFGRTWGLLPLASPGRKRIRLDANSSPKGGRIPGQRHAWQCPGIPPRSHLAGPPTMTPASAGWGTSLLKSSRLYRRSSPQVRISSSSRSLSTYSMHSRRGNCVKTSEKRIQSFT